MPNRTIYVSDAMLAQLEIEAKAANTTVGRVLMRLGLAAVAGAEPSHKPVGARVLTALGQGATTVEEVAKLAEIPLDIARTTLNNLSQLRDDETEKPIVKLNDIKGRAVWSLAAAA